MFRDVPECSMFRVLLTPNCKCELVAISVQFVPTILQWFRTCQKLEDFGSDFWEIATNIPDSNSTENAMKSLLVYT